ncbi:aspartic peptidase domain-containing protein, partial [Chlamydoabsidia padenii]
IDVPLENIDIAYLIDVSVGTPPQPFTLLLDTGSSASWVSSHGCGRFCGFPARALQPSRSESFRSTNMLFTVTYGQGYSHGLFAQDTFNVRGVSVPDVYFGLSFANDGELTDAGAGKILMIHAIGPDALSKFNNPDSKTLPTLVTSMFDHNIINKNVFSIYFHPVNNDTAIWESPINGDITFGG